MPMPLNPFTLKSSSRSIVCYFHNFGNNLGIKRKFAKYFKESCCLLSDQHFSLKCFQKNAFVRKIFPKSSGLFWLDDGRWKFRLIRIRHSHTQNRSSRSVSTRNRGEFIWLFFSFSVSPTHKIDPTLCSVTVAPSNAGSSYRQCHGR